MRALLCRWGSGEGGTGGPGLGGRIGRKRRKTCLVSRAWFPPPLPRTIKESACPLLTFFPLSHRATAGIFTLNPHLLPADPQGYYKTSSGIKFKPGYLALTAGQLFGWHITCR